MFSRRLSFGAAVKLFNSILVYIHCLCIALIPVYVFGANHTNKDNPWTFFYDGDIDTAIKVARSIFAKSPQSNEKIDIALAWMQFCRYYYDAYCMEEPFKYRTALASENTDTLDGHTRAWVETELTNNFVSVFGNYNMF